MHKLFIKQVIVKVFDTDLLWLQILMLCYLIIYQYFIESYFPFNPLHFLLNWLSHEIIATSLFFSEVLPNIDNMTLYTCSVFWFVFLLVTTLMTSRSYTCQVRVDERGPWHCLFIPILFCSYQEIVMVFSHRGSI